MRYMLGMSPHLRQLSSVAAVAEFSTVAAVAIDAWDVATFEACTCNTAV
jgi:hypothetical protein